MKHRVVITGLGIISSIGNDADTVTQALREGRSGTRRLDEWARHGLSSIVAGLPDVSEDRIAAAQIPKKLIKAMSPSALYAAIAARDAVADASLSQELLADTGTACLVGSGVADVTVIHQDANTYYSNNVRRIRPHSVIRSMSSTASALITNLLGITGRSYSIASACATSAHNIGHAYELIRAGLVDRAVTGGCEEVSELITASFQGLRLALSTGFNDRAETASRPYDRDRDGFVISGGAGILILESLDAALVRGARIYGEIIGYDANSDPYDLVLPLADGGTFVDCIRGAISGAGLSTDDIDAVNTHGTGTIAGDIAEVNGLRRVFGKRMPPYSSTKSMTGHAIGAAGAIEVIACLLMMEKCFIAPSINIENLDPEFEGTPVVRETIEKELTHILNLNFGFGGTNAAMIVSRFDG